MLLLSIQQKFSRFDIKVCCVISINLKQVWLQILQQLLMFL